ncbi:hypothetical protein C8J56DRAFT_888858 [Mycena floridula]|nr:hypothetical protein C8J56DRAFT_888858 [Mycena floridula]
MLIDSHENLYMMTGRVASGDHTIAPAGFGVFVETLGMVPKDIHPIPCWKFLIPDFTCQNTQKVHKQCKFCFDAGIPSQVFNISEILWRAPRVNTRQSRNVGPVIVILKINVALYQNWHWGL